jgi:hypothetical protein
MYSPFGEAAAKPAVERAERAAMEKLIILRE